MDISVWVLCWSFEMGFLYLIARNALWLEGSFLSGLIVSWFAPKWNADGIRLFAWLSMAFSSLWFVAGLFSPDLRF